MRYWPKRISFFFQFRRVLRRGREIELEYQKVEQAMNNAAHENDASYHTKEKEYEYRRGVLDGIKKALEIANG